MALLLGAIADDFTGATDLANTLVQQGMRTIQLIGVPSGSIDVGDADAVVVALKSRSVEPELAVRESLAALRWLRDHGTQQYFFKYCSTFDSTPAGNIGPVADALMGELGSELAVICPAFPTNQRTIYKGQLFVKDELLSESPMKDHPLNPMRDSSLVRLMDAQSAHRSGLVTHETVSQGADAIRAAMGNLQDSGFTYAVTDAICDEDLMAIGHACDGHLLVTGGSGVALGLPDNFRRKGLLGENRQPAAIEVPGRSAVLAGSCSQATRAQIGHVKDRWPHRKIDAHELAGGAQVAQEILDWACEQDDNLPILVYASADPDEVAGIQEKYGRAEAGEMIERAFGEIAQGLAKRGTRRIVVAGGETSGAVVSSLAITGLKIGPEIDPGVPWTQAIDAPGIALALKSGNFGADDFFEKALGMLA